MTVGHRAWVVIDSQTPESSWPPCYSGSDGGQIINVVLTNVQFTEIHSIHGPTQWSVTQSANTELEWPIWQLAQPSLCILDWQNKSYHTGKGQVEVSQVNLLPQAYKNVVILWGEENRNLLPYSIHQLLSILISLTSLISEETRWIRKGHWTITILSIITQLQASAYIRPDQYQLKYIVYNYWFEEGILFSFNWNKRSETIHISMEIIHITVLLQGHIKFKHICTSWTSTEHHIYQLHQ